MDQDLELDRSLTTNMYLDYFQVSSNHDDWVSSMERWRMTGRARPKRARVRRDQGKDWKFKGSIFVTFKNPELRVVWAMVEGVGDHNPVLAD